MENWTMEEIDLLKKYTGKGIPCVQGRTKNAIRSKMKKLGLEPNRKKWSEKEIENLKSQFKNKKIKDIFIENRTTPAIHQKLRTLGLVEIIKCPCHRNPCVCWTEEEIENLKKGIKIKNRSKNSIRNMKKRIGIKTEKPKINRTWTKNKEDALLYLVKNKNTVSQILKHRLFKEHTSMSIRKKLSRMKLTSPNPNRFPSKKIKKLKSFVLENKNLSPEEISQKWNKVDDDKTNKRKILRLLHQEGIKYRNVIDKKTLEKIKLFLIKEASFVEIQKRDLDWSKNLVKKWNSSNQFKINLNITRNKLRDLNLIVKFKITKEIEIALENFLINNWKNKTPQQLTNIWNENFAKKYKFLVTKQRVLKYLKKLNLYLGFGEIKKINCLIKKEEEIKKSVHKSSKACNEAIRKERIELMRKRYSQNKSIWSGVKQKEELDFS